MLILVNFHAAGSRSVGTYFPNTGPDPGPRGSGSNPLARRVGTYLNAGHSAGHVEVLPVPAPWLHEGHAVAAAHVLGRVLTRRNVDGRHNVRRVGVEAAYTKYKIKRLQGEISGSPFFMLFGTYATNR